MKLLGKLLAFVFILFALYCVAIFIYPDKADTIGSSVGIMPLNTTIREFKYTLDHLGTKASEFSSGVIDQAATAVEVTKQTISNVQNTLDTKLQQANNVAKSAIDLKQGLETLTTFTGMTRSGTTVTGSILSGSILR